MRLDSPHSATEFQAPRLQIAVAASFTAEPLLESLVFWMHELGLDAAIEFAPYSQVFQELLNPGSLLSQNHGGINIILVRTEDWLRYNTDAHDFEQARLVLERNAGDFIAAMHSAASRSGTPQIVALCPASSKFLTDSSRRSLLESVEQRIISDLREVGGVSLISGGDFAAYPVEARRRPTARRTGAYSVHSSLLRRDRHPPGAADSSRSRARPTRPSFSIATTRSGKESSGKKDRWA